MPIFMERVEVTGNLLVKGEHAKAGFIIHAGDDYSWVPAAFEDLKRLEAEAEARQDGC